MMTQCFCMFLKESNMYYQLKNEAQAATLSSPRRHGRKRRLDSSYREILGLFSCQISLVCFVKILLLATTQLKKKKIQMETDLKFKRNFQFHRNSFPCCLCGLCLPRIN